MTFHQLQKMILLISLPFFINGCMGIVGGTCTYDTIASHAVVKEIEKDHIVLKYRSFFDGKVTEDTFTHIPNLYVGEVLPLEIGIISHGSCVPRTVIVNKKDYFSIKGMVIPFTDYGELKGNVDEKVEFLVEHFLSLKKDYPSAVLSLYEYKNNNFSLSKTYVNKVKTMLTKEGIGIESIKISSKKRAASTTFINLPKNSVHFTVELYN